MHTRPPAADLPKPTDPPVLTAILLGAVKTGDRLTASLARRWLADMGIRITIAKDAVALKPKGGCRD